MVFDKLKSMLQSDEKPKFRSWEDRPTCSMYLVNNSTLLFLGGKQANTSNYYTARLELPTSYQQISDHIFKAIDSVYNPVANKPEGQPYYVAAAGLKDHIQFHKMTSEIGVSWIKKPHSAGVTKDTPLVQNKNYWAPGIYLDPMKRLRRTGSAEGLGNAYNRGPIPPEDHERIGREVLELFDVIRIEFDGGPLPLRQKENQT